jgi:hypothetical protein
MPRWVDSDKEYGLIITIERQKIVVQGIQVVTILLLIPVFFYTAFGLFNILIGNSFYEVFQDEFGDEYETENNYILFKFALRQVVFSLLTTRLLFRHSLFKYFRD